VPSSCTSTLPGVTWKLLIDPTSLYPWSVLWRTGDHSEHVRAVVACAQALSREQGWLQTAGQATG
jgi:hypothetical protein